MIEWKDISEAPTAEVKGFVLLLHDPKTEVTHVSWHNGYDWHNPDSHYYSEAEPWNPTLFALVPEPTKTP